MVILYDSAAPVQSWNFGAGILPDPTDADRAEWAETSARLAADRDTNWLALATYYAAGGSHDTQLADEAPYLAWLAEEADRMAEERKAEELYTAGLLFC